MAIKKKIKADQEVCCKNYYGHKSCGGAVYGLGFIGAAIYFVSNSTGFWMGVLGILKAFIWPAFLVYGLLKFLGI